jgi:hypothetical protein
MRDANGEEGRERGGEREGSFGNEAVDIYLPIKITELFKRNSQNTTFFLLIGSVGVSEAL